MRGRCISSSEMSKRRAQDFSSDGFIKNQLQKDRPWKSIYGKGAQHTPYQKQDRPRQDHPHHQYHLYGWTYCRLNGQSGKTFLQKEGESVTAVECNDGLKEFAEIAFSAPIFGKDTGRPIGVIVNFVNFVEVCNLLQGRFNKELGAISWGKGRALRRTLEMYLVNKDKLMITESIFIKDAALKQTVDTLPVQRGLEANEEIAGFYQDYRGVEVVGASMYIPSMKWTLLLEIDKDEVLPHKKRIHQHNNHGRCGHRDDCIPLYCLSQATVKPLYALSLASNDIAAGNFDMQDVTGTAAQGRRVAKKRTPPAIYF